MTLFEDDLDWPPTLMEQEARYGLLFPGLNQFPNTVAADIGGKKRSRNA